jgi:hypothetical protein
MKSYCTFLRKESECDTCEKSPKGLPLGGIQYKCVFFEENQMDRTKPLENSEILADALWNRIAKCKSITKNGKNNV